MEGKSRWSTSGRTIGVSREEVRRIKNGNDLYILRNCMITVNCTCERYDNEDSHSMKAWCNICGAKGGQQLRAQTNKQTLAP